MRVWRVVDRAFPSEAWTGEGARLHGGRWNDPGHAVVYCSESAALAFLEVLAGGIRLADLEHWALVSAEVPDEEIGDVPSAASEPEQGARWFASGALACRVPSRVVEGWNVLLNPAATTWNRVQVQGETPLDPRLWRS